MRARTRTLVAIAVVLGALFAGAPGPASAGWQDGHKCKIGRDDGCTRTR